MAIKLSSLDIRQILTKQEARLRQLKFEVDLTQRTIKDLKQALPAIESTEAAQLSSMAESSALEIAANVSTPKKTRRKNQKAAPKKERVKKVVAKSKTASKDRSTGYRLSEYDNLLFAALENSGRAMLTADLIAFVKTEKAAQGDKITDEKAANMVARSLQKLANRREEIRKVAYAGRGKAYALPSWVRRNGTIKPAHRYKES